MSYSYYTTPRSLDTLLDDADLCSDSNNYRTAETAAAVDNLLHSVSSKFAESQTDPGVQTFSALHGNRAAKTGTATGVVQLLLPIRTFKHRTGRTGFVRSFIVVDEHAQQLNADVWRYKFVAWNEQAKTLNVELNHTYRFSHFKMKPVKGNCDYPGQDEHELHLTPISTIDEVTA